MPPETHLSFYWVHLYFLSSQYVVLLPPSFPTCSLTPCKMLAHFTTLCANIWMRGTGLSARNGNEQGSREVFFFFLDSGFVRLTKTTWSLGYHQNCSLWIILAETQDLWVDGIRQVASASSRPKRRTETPRCFDPWSSVCDPVHTGVNVQVCVCVWFLHLVLVLLAFQSRGYTNYNFMSPSTCTLMPSCGTP